MSTLHLIETLMKGPVQSLEADVATVDALQFAESYGIHHFPVTDHGKITGLVCTCDLENIDLRAPVRRALRRPAMTISRHASVEDAVRLMSEEEVGSLLVTENGSVVGIVTREDLPSEEVSTYERPGFRCVSCGSVKHLKSEGTQGTLCLDCRSRALPEAPDDGTGVGD
jgi:predicted transcriptional regulator